MGGNSDAEPSTRPLQSDSERIAALEREVADRRREFQATKYVLEMAFLAGRASALPTVTGRPANRGPRLLRAVGGEQ